MKIILFSLLLVAAALGKATPKRKGYGPGEQEWGFVDVRSGAHMFYWLFYTQAAQVNDFTERPLVIWLQGGPGASSTGYGNFAELGPLHVNGSEREYSWVKYVNVMFIDNPVGSGFSYVDRTSDLVTNNVEIGSDMVEFLRQFYKQYPDFSKTSLYIFCESYGGKMVSEIAKQLDAAIKSENLKINFKGVALGDSWVSPIDSVRNWGPFLLYAGVVDLDGYNAIQEGADSVQKAIDAGDWSEATNRWGSLEGEVIYQAGNVDFYNILYEVGYNKKEDLRGLDPIDILKMVHVNHIARDDDADIQSLMEGPVKKALGIDKNIVHGSQGGRVFQALAGDFMKPVTTVVEELLNNTQVEVNVFSGQLDLIVETIGTVQWVYSLNWPGKTKWRDAERTALLVNNIVEGYHKGYGNLNFYWVDRSGHMVPTDNPLAAVEILSRVTKLSSSTKS